MARSYRSAIRRLPRRILTLTDRYRNLVHKVRYRDTLSHTTLIEELESETEFLLIILDACRFDYFHQEVGDFLSGDLNLAHTEATYTIDYTRRTWEGNHDLTYLTAIPAPSDHAFERKGLDYRPSDHIDELVHIWSTCEDTDLGVVPPEKMTEAAIRMGHDRMVVHYAQPHAPYIGEYRLRDESADTTWKDSLNDIYTKIGRYSEAEKTISDDELQAAYRANLRRALASVEDLVRHFDRPTVVTADHGELLGEDGRYIHGGSKHPCLCEVPWFTVADSMLGTDELSGVGEGDEPKEVSKAAVEEQLETLGYK